MSILVTGATGHLGRLIIESLITRGTDPSMIVASGRDADRLAAAAPAGVRTAVADYDDRASLDAALAGVQTLVLVSASNPGSRLEQHRAVIDAAVAAGVERIVYTSAPHADNSELVLAPDHRETEKLIRESGIPSTILRNNWYNENYLGLLDQVRETGVFAAGTGEGRVASASRADFAAAAAVVATDDGHVGRVYELSGDTSWNGHELAAILSDVLDREVVWTPLDSDAQLAALLEAGVPEGGAGFAVALDGNIRDGALADVTSDLTDLIGRPTTPIADTFRAAL
jgi:NAD(P)H dehydrogenase (quinone)